MPPVRPRHLNDGDSPLFQHLRDDPDDASARQTHLDWLEEQGATPFQRFCEKWGRGCGASICAEARNVCLCRGSIPADLLCIAEAPGESEDVIGQPLVGPAGQLLDYVLDQALGHFRVCDVCRRDKRLGNELHLFPGQENPTFCDNGHGEEDAGPVRIAYCNLTGCIPRAETGGKAEQPLPEDIRQCSARLREFAELVDPKLILQVGILARDWTDPKMHGCVWHLEDVGGRRKSSRLSQRSRIADVPAIHVVHPAAILRAKVGMLDLMVRKVVIQVRTAVEKYVLCPQSQD